MSEGLAYANLLDKRKVNGVHSFRKIEGEIESTHHLTNKLSTETLVVQGCETSVLDFQTNKDSIRIL